MELPLQSVASETAGVPVQGIDSAGVGTKSNEQWVHVGNSASGTSRECHNEQG
jgi:hypothetical protein